MTLTSVCPVGSHLVIPMKMWMCVHASHLWHSGMTSYPQYSEMQMDSMPLKFLAY